MKIRPKSELPFHLLNDEQITTENHLYNDDRFDGDKRLIVVSNKFPTLNEWENIDEILLDNKQFYNQSIKKTQDAEFIVHACNNYEKLVEALKSITSSVAMSLFILDKEELDTEMRKCSELLLNLKEIEREDDII